MVTRNKGLGLPQAAQMWLDARMQLRALCFLLSFVGVVGCPSEPTMEVCGNGVVGSIEECDDGDNDVLDACTGDCKRARCGDGFVRQDLLDDDDDHEECDDRNTVDTDGCTAQCKRAFCGDGIKRRDLLFGQMGYEACDDGNIDDTDACWVAWRPVVVMA